MNPIFKTITEQNETKLISWLKKASIDELTLRNEKGQEPLPLCARLGWTRGIELLLAAGVPANRADKDSTNFKSLDVPPLLLAIRGGHADAAKLLLQHDQNFKLYSDHGDAQMAFSFFAKHHGWVAAIDFFEPLKTFGYNALNHTSVWLSLGISKGIKKPEDQEAIEQWMLSELGNLESKDQRNACFHYLLASAGDPWVSLKVAKLYRDQFYETSALPTDNALFLARWAIEEGQPEFMRLAAERLSEHQDVSRFAIALQEMASKTPSSSHLEDSSLVMKQKESLDIAFSSMKLSSYLSKKAIEEIGYFAYITGQIGLVFSLFEQGLEKTKIPAWRHKMASAYSSIKPLHHQLHIEVASSILETHGAEQVRAFFTQLNPFSKPEAIEILFSETEQHILKKHTASSKQTVHSSLLVSKDSKGLRL